VSGELGTCKLSAPEQKPGMEGELPEAECRYSASSDLFASIDPKRRHRLYHDKSKIEKDKKVNGFASPATRDSSTNTKGGKNSGETARGIGVFNL